MAGAAKVECLPNAERRRIHTVATHLVKEVNVGEVEVQCGLTTTVDTHTHTHTYTRDVCTTTNDSETHAVQWGRELTLTHIMSYVLSAATGVEHALKCRL
jgi:hypothetical protein